MRPQFATFQRPAAAAIAIAALIGVAFHYPDFVLGKDAWSVVWSTVDFFSKFTIECNLLVAAITAAIAVDRRGVITRLRVASAACIYLLVAGVTYAVLLNDVYHPEGITLIAIVLQHYVVPPAYFVFWLLFVPKGELSVRDAAIWLFFPLAYTGYSLLRGAVIGWYPYPFLDAGALGYGAVLQTVALMILGFSLVGLLLIAIDRAMGRRLRRRTVVPLSAGTQPGPG